MVVDPKGIKGDQVRRKQEEEYIAAQGAVILGAPMIAPIQGMEVDGAKNPGLVYQNPQLIGQVNPEGIPVQPLEGMDLDICSKCNLHQLPNNQFDVFWIGCENDSCGKWYHTKCVNMSEEEYYKHQDEEIEWFCTEECKREHQYLKRGGNSQGS